MNNLTTTLLGGVALAALAIAPATAGSHHALLHVSAMHAGHAVNKSKIHNQGATHVVYTFSVYSTQAASAPPKTHLIFTYYKWNSNGTTCSAPKMKIKAPKKSVYAKIGTASETYSLGCSSGPTVYLGDTWTNKTGVAGNTDSFVSTLDGKFSNGSTKYKGTLNLDVSVAIH
jgi:hypothetical protein